MHSFLNIAFAASLLATTSALTQPLTERSKLSLFETSTESENGKSSVHRRNFLSTFATACASTIIAPKQALADPENLNAFNSLTFNYRGSDFVGLDASTLNEPSISYSEFLEKLSAGEVTFVEFMAPDGDTAYATLKSKDGEGTEKPIRIGQGYPIEQHDGWSSPAFAVRSVKEKGVAYKFTVPALAKYK